jgi:hypothetical protein
MSMVPPSPSGWKPPSPPGHSRPAAGESVSGLPRVVARPARAIARRRFRNGLESFVGRGSPFTVSLAAHTLVLIVLALVVTVRTRTERITLDLSLASPEVVEDEAVGVRIATVPDPADVPEETTDASEEQVVADAAAAPVTVPEVVDDAAGATTELVARRVPLGMLLDGREEGRREPLVRAFGGSDETEAAVARALEWLARQQVKTGPEAGLWRLTGPYADGGSQENPLAATSMALLAFQGAGNTPATGRHAQAVAKGWAALVKRQSPSGGFDFADIPHQHALYAHAMATSALCELFGMTKDPAHAPPAAAALGYAVAAQGPNGGWRYAPGDPGDMSVTGWYVMALKSGEIAGLPVPAAAFARIGDFLDSVALGGGTHYAYRRYSELKPPTGVTPAVWAEGLLARQLLGWDRADPRMIAGVEGLLAETPLDWENAKNVYAWYYVTQVVHNLGGEPWARWNEGLKQLLPRHQVAKGREAGSWDPSLDQWGPHGGRLFITCFCTWMLEVYYRHLPLYDAVAPPVNQPAAEAAADRLPVAESPHTPPRPRSSRR